MTIGTVKFFNATKGFGFIQPDTGGADVFVHISAVERAGMRTIVEGQKISFDVVKDARSGKSAAEESPGRVRISRFWPTTADVPASAVEALRKGRVRPAFLYSRPSPRAAEGLAEGVRFELTVELPPRRFSRPLP